DTSRKRSSRGSPVGGSSVRREARHEEPIREIAEGVDHSFSFNYGRRDRMFFTHGAACADLASKVRGDFAEFPAVDSLRGRELYEDWASRSFQAMSQTNRLVGFYEEQCRAAARDSDLAKAAAEASDRSAQSHLRNYNSEKSRCADLTRQLKDKKKQYLSETDRLRRARDESAAAERHRVAGEIHEYRTRIDRMERHIVGLREKKKPLLMLSQVSGMEKCLKKMVINGTHITLRNLAQVEQDHIQWRATLEPLFGVAAAELVDVDAPGEKAKVESTTNATVFAEVGSTTKAAGFSFMGVVPFEVGSATELVIGWASELRSMLGWSMLSTGMTRRRSGLDVDASVASASAGALSLRGILVKSNCSNNFERSRTTLRYASIRSFLAS
ncbi:hypothetical protein CARUB_v100255921mg, partial [Capsella rubella]